VWAEEVYLGEGMCEYKNSIRRFSGLCCVEVDVECMMMFNCLVVGVIERRILNGNEYRYESVAKCAKQETGKGHISWKA
jgi:hypothetical protein